MSSLTIFQIEHKKGEQYLAFIVIIIATILAMLLCYISVIMSEGFIAVFITSWHYEIEKGYKVGL